MDLVPAKPSWSDDSTSSMPPQAPDRHPELVCACGHHAAVWTAHTNRNDGKKFLKCIRRNNGCRLWIWEHTLEAFASIRASRADASLARAVSYIKEKTEETVVLRREVEAHRKREERFKVVVALLAAMLLVCIVLIIGK